MKQNIRFILLIAFIFSSTHAMEEDEAVSRQDHRKYLAPFKYLVHLGTLAAGTGLYFLVANRSYDGPLYHRNPDYVAGDYTVISGSEKYQSNPESENALVIIFASTASLLFEITNDIPPIKRLFYKIRDSLKGR